ncbi:MAG TPA: hypothetical protein VIY86_01680, partial [Pirellulaceae bacterium]
MNDMDLSGRILRHLSHDHYRPVKPRVLARQLGLEPEEMPAVRRAIKGLIRAGKARFGPKHLLGAVSVPKGDETGEPLPATTADDERVGRFSRASAG